MNSLNPLGDTPVTDADDLVLVRRIREGDRDALEALVTRRQAWIYNVVLRMVYQPQDAEDATQELLIKLLTKLSTFDGRSSFRTWLYRIVVNHVLNMKRARRGGGVDILQVRARAGERGGHGAAGSGIRSPTSSCCSMRHATISGRTDP